MPSRCCVVRARERAYFDQCAMCDVHSMQCHNVSLVKIIWPDVYELNWKRCAQYFTQLFGHSIKYIYIYSPHFRHSTFAIRSGDHQQPVRSFVEISFSKSKVLHLILRKCGHVRCQLFTYTHNPTHTVLQVGDISIKCAYMTLTKHKRRIMWKIL